MGKHYVARHGKGRGKGVFMIIALQSVVILISSLAGTLAGASGVHGGARL